MKTLLPQSYAGSAKILLTVLSVFISWWGAGALAVEASAATHTSIVIKAVVLPIATIKIITEPSTLTVTGMDIRRGYVDADPSLLEIRTNSRRGCVLTLSAYESVPFRETEVTFPGHTVLVNHQGGMILLPLFGRQMIRIRYRFILGSDTPPGTYNWPFSLSISPR